MNIDITPQHEKRNQLWNIIHAEIIEPGSPDKEIIEDFLTESINEYIEIYGEIKDISDAKIYCLFSIIKQMRILDGSWDPNIELE